MGRGDHKPHPLTARDGLDISLQLGPYEEERRDNGEDGDIPLKLKRDEEELREEGGDEDGEVLSCPNIVVSGVARSQLGR